MPQADYGFATQLGFGTSSAATVRLDFLSEDLGLHEEFPYLGGLRGVRSRDVSRVKAGIRRCGGPISAQPSHTEISGLLPMILGTGSVLTDALPYYWWTADRVTKVPTYGPSLVNRATFHASQAGPLGVNLDIVACDESIGNAASFPSLTIDTASAPYMFWECVLTFNSVTYSTKQIEISIDNHLDTDRILNSQTLSTLFNAKDREVNFSTTLPYGEALAAYNTGPAGVTITAVFTCASPSHTLTFSMVKSCVPRKPFGAKGREEIMVPLQGGCYQSGSTKELVVTLT